MKTLKAILWMLILFIAGCAAPSKPKSIQANRYAEALKMIYDDPNIAYAIDEMRLQMRYRGNER